ncbi:tripartite tricarboxylate transporter substrate binding protein [Ideonella livida]|uniref:Tripartite tricarboxylate transporter substrate binding protein n=1 Tax=Ideonella livida TaxID=2707176 RepID=A0A7C9PKW1_9BURK|nr:tripartite tricarboxylate transporter substrate binding protein [Ideonella livida]NDY93892.1 tripartite tricarboxylate transporter substrate binding protein [Ideonella livida]
MHPTRLTLPVPGPQSGALASSGRRRWLRHSLALLGAAALAASGLLPAPALAQTPVQDGTLRLIVPFPAGGITDAAARALAERLGPALGQTVVVENRPGAGSRLGVQAVMQAAPDGRTLLFTNTSYSILPIVEPASRLHPLTDLQPLGMTGRYGLFVAVQPQLPVKTLGELVQHLRQHPGRVSYGSAGHGSGTHFAVAQLESLTGTELNHVPYKSTAAALNDVAGGQVDLTLDAGAHVLARSGKVRVLATTAPRRSPLMPEVPTVAEAGLPGFTQSSWVGLFAPAATPAPVLARLRQALQRCQADPAMAPRLEALGLVPEPGDTATLQQALKDDSALYRRIAREGRLQFD